MDTVQSTVDKLFELKDGNGLFYQHHFLGDEFPTVVFLNGLSQSTMSWGAVAPSFIGKCNVLLLDQVFQGKSTAVGEFRSYDEHATDVTLLIQSLGIGKPVLCGLSYGSAVAQHALVLFPETYSGAVLMSTFAHNAEVFMAMGESWKSALKAGGYALLLDVMLPVVLGASYFEKPLIPIQTLKEMRISNNLSAENLFKLMMATETRGDYREKLRNVKVPVLVIHGEEDLLIPVAIASQVNEFLPESDFVVLEKVGHTLNLEAIPQITALIREYLEKNIS
jgi:pimeloyl-ACP methyl ester carboxylesterase